MIAIYKLSVPKMGRDCGIFGGNPTPGDEYFRTPILGFAEVGGVFIPRVPLKKLLHPYSHLRIFDVTRMNRKHIYIYMNDAHDAV